MDKKTEEFYVRLKDELDKSNTWPAEYLYKFIVPSENHKIAQIESAFDQMGAVIKTTQSKNGNFTSCHFFCLNRSVWSGITPSKSVSLTPM